MVININDESKKVEIRSEIWNLVRSIKSAEDIAGFFSFLDYPEDYVHKKPLQRKKENFDFRKEDAERISNIFSPLSFEEDLPVFLIEVKSLLPSFIRSVTSSLDKQYLHFMAIYTIDYSEIQFIYPQKKKDEKGKRKLTLTKLVLRKDDLHYTEVQTLSKIKFKQGDNWRKVWLNWGEAFNVESVTREFFEDYKKVFLLLRKEILDQGIVVRSAHEFSLQLLNRVMFVYFISKKGWFKDRQLIKWLWESYKKETSYGSGQFYSGWLIQLFFKSFNNRIDEIKGLPGDVLNVLIMAPYLNGGLFSEKDFDRLGIVVTDAMFKNIIEFYEKYNFTIKEDMPLDKEVAVDPQMIGYVYESLANVAEEIYDRNDLGIFYTPRVEVDLMCRRSVAEVFVKRLSDVDKTAIYHFVFDAPEDNEKVSYLNKYDSIWQRLEEILNNLSIVDLACGSGAFMVGMLDVLSELYLIVYKHNGAKISNFDMKYGIIQRSLYGVDVMPWAVRAAELRLWLQLVVDTELSLDELRKGPLLPNLNLKLRVGDSMVQEIGGIGFNIRTGGIDDKLRHDLDSLKREKDKFFEGSRTARYTEVKQFCSAETAIFLRIIDSMVKRLEKSINTSKSNLTAPTKQVDLFGNSIKKEVQLEFNEPDKRKETEEEIKRLEKEVIKLKSVRSVLDDPEKKPFIWDIDFAEIFGDKNGFDIVIGNPPYVRQEMISPPNRLKSEVTLKDRQDYKEKLLNSVKTQFPVIKDLDKKSDLYIYFYFHGLSLLNEKGVFCFITSNSWLDVGYGEDLQEFLLKYVPILAIYDNPKRSFEHAAVNTTITVLGAPALREESFEEKIKSGVNAKWTKLSNVARFVMFKKPFEEVISAETMLSIENANAKERGGELTDLASNIVQTEMCRIFPVVQEDLLEDGWEYPEEYDRKRGRFKKGNYIGNKWGGKYLRAPDIFYTILRKGKGKLVKLGDVSKIKRGFTTGVNEFFYLDEEAQRKWQIENEFLKPVIKSPKENKSITINPNNFKYKVFMCNKSKDELVGTKASKYIEWGESVGFNKRSSVSSRKKWYDLGEWNEPKVIIPCGIGDSYRVFLNSGKVFTDKRMYFLNPNDEKMFVLSTNSTLYMLMQELNSRVGLGDGLLDLTVFEVASAIILDPKLLSDELIVSSIFSREINSIFVECGLDPNRPMFEQEPRPLQDRAKLDDYIFKKIGLTDEEIKEVYLSVCELIQKRIAKAKS